MFTKILIANRGEIAVRVIRACRELGIATVAVYSEADREALHVRLADQAVLIGPAPAAESYLQAERMIAAALECGAQAIHPGYGFLSERAHFARACQAAGLVFIGPPPEAIALMGDKIAAKRLAEQSGVPILPGYLGDDQRPERLRAEAERVGFPLLIKASAGGGGRGMRVVRAPAEFDEALAGARREARAAFGDDSVFLERLVERPRHVEVQVLADRHGNVVHLFERECSIQRRHQKIVEESPCPALSPPQREAIGAAAVALARAAGYVNAGTVEFLLDEMGSFFFLEMNARLQVEHPVTELVIGVDLVRLQIAIAAGEQLPVTQADLTLRGHAIEARVCAEDPGDYLPAAGRLALFAPPVGPGLRNDVGVASGDTVTVHYDSLIAKLIVHGVDRAAALERLQRALADYMVLGVTTNLPLLRAIAAHPAFAVGETATDFLSRHAVTRPEPTDPAPLVLAAAAILDTRRVGRAGTARDPWAAGAWRSADGAARRAYLCNGREHTVWVERRGNGYQVHAGEAILEIEAVAEREGELILRENTAQERFCTVREGLAWLIGWCGAEYRLERAPGLSVDGLGGRHLAARGHASMAAPMPGTVVRVLASEGDRVEAQQPLVVIEAMKMEHIVAAPSDGIVQRVLVTQGALVARGAVLIDLASG